MSHVDSSRAGLGRAPALRVIGLALVTIAALMAATEAAAALTWNWSYSGAGITAAGTFTTSDSPDGSGFYLITGISGERNGAPILSLQPTGTPIPGNEPFAVDNLVRLESPQLTKQGFGYAIAGGAFSNPFFADFLQPPTYLEFFSVPPGGSSELPIVFSATPVPTAQTVTWVLVPAGLASMALARLLSVHWGRRATFGTCRS